MTAYSEMRTCNVAGSKYLWRRIQTSLVATQKAARRPPESDYALLFSILV